MHPALRALLTQTVTFEPFVSRTDYGKESYGAPVSYPARVTEQLVLVRQPDGSEKLARHKVRLDGDAVIEARGRLTLPDGSQPPILSVDRAPDETGGTYTVLVRTE